ncbi:hypothetical protein NL462_27500, partial [Klebsiella pneumoniae]|nr:hypothetical protein [Klebsiella pneumoniae]
MLENKGSLQAARDFFAWDIPARFNIAQAVCDRWADSDPDRTAIIDVASDGSSAVYSFSQLRNRASQLAHS